MQETQMLGTGYQQEVSLEKLFMDVAVYNEMIRVPTQTTTLVDLAVRHALSRRGVAHLTIPTDIQIADADANPWEATAPAVIKPTAPIFIEAPGVPDARVLQQAADVLNAGNKIVMLVGAGALHARDDVLRVADLLGSPVIKTLARQRQPYPIDTLSCLAVSGFSAPRPLKKRNGRACDTLFMVGTNFPYTKHLPEPGQAKVVQIEVDPVRAGNRIATDVPLVGDAKQTLAALAPLLLE